GGRSPLGRDGRGWHRRRRSGVLGGGGDRQPETHGGEKGRESPHVFPRTLVLRKRASAAPGSASSPAATANQYASRASVEGQAGRDVPESAAFPLRRRRRPGGGPRFWLGMVGLGAPAADPEPALDDRLPAQPALPGAPPGRPSERPLGRDRGR